MKGETAHNLKPTKSPRRRPNKRVRDTLLERISHEYDSTRQKMPADHPRFALFCYFSTVAASMVSWVYGDPVRYPFPDAYKSERLYKLAQWLGQVEDQPIEERKELRRARIADLCRVFPAFLERCTYDDDVSGVLLWTWDGIEAVWREEIATLKQGPQLYSYDTRRERLALMAWLNKNAPDLEAHIIEDSVQVSKTLTTEQLERFAALTDKEKLALMREYIQR